MKRILYYIEMIIILTIVWIILNEKIAPVQIISGILISITAIFFTDYYLFLGDYKRSYQVNPIIIIKYFIYLVFQIYKSGIASIVKVIKGNNKVRIVEYETSIDNDLLICLLANAITLTPGTVTIDKSGNKLKILCLDSHDGDENSMGNNVNLKFEKILKGGQ